MIIRYSVNMNNFFTDLCTQYRIDLIQELHQEIFRTKLELAVKLLYFGEICTNKKIT